MYLSCMQVPWCLDSASGFGAIGKIFFSWKYSPKSHLHFSTTGLLLGTNEANVLCHFVF